MSDRLFVSLVSCMLLAGTTSLAGCVAFENLDETNIDRADAGGNDAGNNRTDDTSTGDAEQDAEPADTEGVPDVVADAETPDSAMDSGPGDAGTDSAPMDTAPSDATEDSDPDSTELDTDDDTADAFDASDTEADVVDAETDVFDSGTDVFDAETDTPDTDTDTDTSGPVCLTCVGRCQLQMASITDATASTYVALNTTTPMVQRFEGSSPAGEVPLSLPATMSGQRVAVGRTDHQAVTYAVGGSGTDGGTELQFGQLVGSRQTRPVQNGTNPNVVGTAIAGGYTHFQPWQDMTPPTWAFLNASGPFLASYRGVIGSAPLLAFQPSIAVSLDESELKATGGRLVSIRDTDGNALLWDAVAGHVGDDFIGQQQPFRLREGNPRAFDTSVVVHRGKHNDDLGAVVENYSVMEVVGSSLSISSWTYDPDRPSPMEEEAASFDAISPNITGSPVWFVDAFAASGWVLVALHRMDGSTTLHSLDFVASQHQFRNLGEVSWPDEAVYEPVAVAMSGYSSGGHRFFFSRLVRDACGEGGVTLQTASDWYCNTLDSGNTGCDDVIQCSEYRQCL